MTAPQDHLEAMAFFGGGTGGHLYPGIALAERAVERFPGCRVVFFRTSRSVEEKCFEGRGVEARRIAIRVPTGSALGWIKYSLDVARARREIRRELAKGFDVAFGLGGYASVPGILAARAERIPVILLEQNRVAGRVNRLFAPHVSAISCSCQETARDLKGRAKFTGNPVRKDVLEAARIRSARSDAGAVRTVLVFGGSQGASGINHAVAGALRGLEEFRQIIRWIHVTGDADKEDMQEAYRKHRWNARVLAYAPDLPYLMAESDLALARAGGTTLAELAVIGLPAVLVPYPYHKDQHQLQNAQLLLDRGGAMLLEEKDLTSDSLRRVFRDVLLASEKLEAMGRNARAASRPDAADRVIDLALGIKRPCLQPSDCLS